MKIDNLRNIVDKVNAKPGLAASNLVSNYECDWEDIKTAVIENMVNAVICQVPGLLDSTGEVYFLFPKEWELTVYGK